METFFIVRGGHKGKMILAKNNRTYPENMIGIGGYLAKGYKNKKAAEKKAKGILNGFVEEISE